MNNYKEIIYNTLEELEDGIKELRDDYDDRCVELKLKSLDIVKVFFDQRYTNEVKQYNSDKSIEAELFIATKHLNLLTFYIEEFYFIDREVNDDNKEIRKNMRIILQHLWLDVNDRVTFNL